MPELFDKKRAFYPPFERILLDLFLAPQQVLFEARLSPKVGRALVLVLFVMLVSSLVTALALCPSSIRRVGEATSWFGTQVESVRRVNNRLVWTPRTDIDQELFDVKGIQIDFMPAGSIFPENPVLQKRAEETESPVIIWLSPRYVVFGCLMGGHMFSVTAFDAEAKETSLSWKKRFPEGKTVYGHEFRRIVEDRISWHYFLPFLAFYRGVSVLASCGFFLFLFTVFPILFRSPLAVGGFRSVLCVNLYLSVVPILVATVYFAAMPERLKFDTIFLFAFFIYTFWAFVRLKNVQS